MMSYQSSPSPVTVTDGATTDAVDVTPQAGAKSTLSRRGALSVGALGIAGISLTACSDESGSLSEDPSKEGSSSDEAKEEEKPENTLIFTPADGSADATAAAELVWSLDGGEIGSVSLVDADGNEIAGDFHSDKTSWIPDGPLAWETAYTATITGTDSGGKDVQGINLFTTIASPPTRAAINFYTPLGATIGQAAVIAWEFMDGYVVPDDEAIRTQMERRMVVTSEPAQEGSWYWMNGTKFEYRPKEYWQPGTTVSFRMGLGGFDFGDGTYGDVDFTGDFTIDTEARELVIDNATKHMSATLDGAQQKNIPISLGADNIDGNDARSYSGTMIIMSREEESEFVSELYDYETDVKWAMRLTWSGQYIHGAPWAKEAGALGSTNISHGCINADDPEAEWVYNFVKWGDPVVVKGTGLDLPQGDGITSWSMDWSALTETSYLS